MSVHSSVLTVCVEAELAVAPPLPEPEEVLEVPPEPEPPLDAELVVPEPELPLSGSGSVSPVDVSVSSGLAALLAALVVEPFAPPFDFAAELTPSALVEVFPPAPGDSAVPGLDGPSEQAAMMEATSTRATPTRTRMMRS